ncbi:MAG: hypothetical protein A3K19_03810 [Lentisphaerae bacterium RIFOXYB12_FULL_65_16]|nr:MAG: hypothetical protein A3K18_03055 [Lentisphaerae bacterium RIFOXYA12_64_32]OGV89270.1 MAG: hypothetical protein A3K19_03810 [Lentisphaerae bacterium RIFOXYB12_FULL_65_16]
MALGLALTATLPAEDWPTYRHDNHRSAITTESLAAPLAEAWVFRPRHAPQPAWEAPRTEPVEGIRELGRIQFDDTYHAVVAGVVVYFGTSTDHKVYALDAATGAVKWVRVLDGPVRLAPAVVGNRLYVGSDDGVAYCLDAATGGTAWQRRIGPGDERLLGNGKMISRWPLRTGLLVDQDTVYCGAGIWPAEGVYLAALRADDGQLVWRNDTFGESTETLLSPQGYLLATDSNLFVPQGRVPPAAFSRTDGRLLYTATFGKTIGGGYALIADDMLFTGTEEVMSFRQADRVRFAWFDARQILVAPEVTYVAGDKELAAITRKDYGAPSVNRFGLRDQRQALGYQLSPAKRAVQQKEAAAKAVTDRIAKLDEQVATARGAGKDVEVQALQKQRDAAQVELDAANKALDEARQALAPLEAQQHDLDARWDKAGADMDACRLWKLECACPDALIMAGGTLYAGGQDTVVAVDAATGKNLWSGKVQGCAKGLAVANGRLFVSTDSGAIHCFASNGAAVIGPVTEPVTEQPFPADAQGAFVAAAAAAAVSESGVTRGYCLVLGGGSGRMAFELAKRTQLSIICIEPDAKLAEVARTALDAAGLYGARVTVDCCPLAPLPYSDYFADLIVSEQALLGRLDGGSAAEMFRVLKPHGGVALFGQPAPRPSEVAELAPAAVRQWLTTCEMPGATVSQTPLGYIKVDRGPLPGAATWTHQYADAGNTGGSTDTAVKCPLGLLWYGRPGPLNMISRHRRAAAPLTTNGVLLVQGENVVMGYDPYNGLQLWERELPKVVRDIVSHDCSNLAADPQHFYVVHQKQCLQLDAKTGEVNATYEMPGPAEGRVWGYVAAANNLLFGSRTKARMNSDAVFALDPATGTVLWTYTGKTIAHPSISVADGKVFFVDDTVSPEERQAALGDRLSNAKPEEVERILKNAPVRKAVCLDARTGRPVWERPVDLTGGIGGLYWSSLGTMVRDGVLVIFGIYSDGHYWQDFFAHQFESRRIVVLAAATGEKMWERQVGYRVRPLIVGDTLHAEPWAYDLRTGEQKMRVNPLTGYEEPWQYARPGHHCGCPVGAPNCLFFRSGHLGYYDLLSDSGVTHFSTQRAGCWINFIFGNGLVMVPEASSGCMCPFANMCTVVFASSSRDRAWAKYSLTGRATPVKHLAVNLGAPGDRKDPAGTLWLAFPRPGGALVLQTKVDLGGWPGGNYFRNSPDFMPVAGTTAPWLYTFGYAGLKRCEIPLVAPGEGTARYTVRLGFADLVNDQPGQRVFGIALQGKTVLDKLDVVQEVGGARKALVKEFTGIEVTDKLAIDLLPATPNPPLEQAPILQSIEVLREQMLTAGLQAPSFLLNDDGPAQTVDVVVENHKAERFSGILQVVVPQGFTVSPDRIPVDVASGGSARWPLTAKLAVAVAPGVYPLEVQLVRADGGIEASQKTEIEYLGKRGRIVLKAVEDTYGNAGAPGVARGKTPTLLVDGGNEKVGDDQHSVAYLKFDLGDIPGRAVLARLRLANAGNPTSNGGNVNLVPDTWAEGSLTYQNRPPVGDLLGNLGPVEPLQVLELDLKVDLTGRRVLALAIDPVNCDGTDYFSREGATPPELRIEYEK